jgi:translation initiation factor 1
MKKQGQREQYRVVYSTETGAHCSECGKPNSNCSCAAVKKAKILGDGVVRVKRETGGRAGKTVSVIYGLPLTSTQLDGLASELKKACGCGGSAKDGTIEIQGDRVEQLVRELIRRGFAAKRGGG